MRVPQWFHHLDAALLPVHPFGGVAGRAGFRRAALIAGVQVALLDMYELQQFSARPRAAAVVDPTWFADGWAQQAPQPERPLHFDSRQRIFSRAL